MPCASARTFGWDPGCLANHLSIHVYTGLLKTSMMLPHFVLFANVVHILHWEELRARNIENWVLLIVLCLTSNVNSCITFHPWWLLFPFANHGIDWMLSEMPSRFCEEIFRKAKYNLPSLCNDPGPKSCALTGSFKIWRSNFGLTRKPCGLNKLW